MPRVAEDVWLSLLPLPRELRVDCEGKRVAVDGPVELNMDDPRVERAVLRGRSQEPVKRGADTEHGPTIRIAFDPGQVPHRDGYRLVVRPHGIDLVGGSPAGCFYGWQTLRQLSTGGQATVPCCSILDWPDFDTRGLLHDITRGKSPTLETLKTLVDRLACLKVNQLQLYMEHAFVFPFDPAICGPDEGVTPEEVCELDDYCRERFIDLVPALATFGHMGRILSMPKYRHLAEVEATQTWHNMSWPQRMRGLTLDGSNPEAHQLIQRMWSDVLDVFSSPVVNICGDEPWDLGRGKNGISGEADSRDELYLNHIKRTHQICAARGRRTQVWSDVIRTSRGLLNRLPKELIILHWGYDDLADYKQTAALVSTGLDTLVCPGTSGWKRVINAMNLAERNIATFAAEGRENGASGLLNTDWGDHGHFNLLACSWHGIALGAAHGWRADHPGGEGFDERFARVMLGLEDGTGIRLLRQASEPADRCETWRLLRVPWRAVHDDSTCPTPEAAARAGQGASEFLRWCDRINQENIVDPRDLQELATACRFTGLLAEKITLAHRGKCGSGRFETSEQARRVWAEKLSEAGNAYAACWQARNKPSGLDDILRALSSAADDRLSG